MNKPRDFEELAKAINDGRAWYDGLGEWKKLSSEIPASLAFNHVYHHWVKGANFHIGHYAPEAEEAEQ